MHLVYILKSQSTGRYYVGMTSDIAKRLMYHNNGANRSTRKKGPWEVVYTEQFADKGLAWARERQIKSYKGGVAFKRLLAK